MIVRAGGVIWLNPFATVLSSVCSAVTVECCFVPMLHGCVWYGCCYKGKKALHQYLCRRDMGQYEVSLSMTERNEEGML